MSCICSAKYYNSCDGILLCFIPQQGLCTCLIKSSSVLVADQIIKMNLSGKCNIINICCEKVIGKGCVFYYILEARSRK